MKKKLAAVVVALALCLGLSACHEQGTIAEKKITVKDGVSRKCFKISLKSTENRINMCDISDEDWLKYNVGDEYPGHK